MAASLHCLVWLVAVGLAVGEKALSQPRAGQREKAAHGKPKPLSGNRNAFARYHFDVWTTDNGLPQNSVSSILQTRDGFLWFTTNDGLARYDGVHFTIYNAGNTKDLKSSRLSQLFEDREGILWIGTTSGLNRLRDDIITFYSTAEGLAANNTYPICQDGEGTIWIGAWAGLTRYKDGVFAQCGEQYAVATALVTALMSDLEGGLWIGTWGAGVKRWKDGNIVSYLAKDGLPSDIVRAILQDHRGMIWFGCSQGLASYKDGAFTSYTTKDGLPSDAVNVIFEDSRGNLWIGTQRGLCRYDDGQFSNYPQASDQIIRAVYEDSEGAIWIGTYNSGLTRIKNGRMTGITQKEGLFNNGVFQILEDATENFWISCNLGIYRVSKKELNDYAEGRSRSIINWKDWIRTGLTREPGGWLIIHTSRPAATVSELSRRIGTAYGTLKARA